MFPFTFTEFGQFGQPDSPVSNNALHPECLSLNPNHRHMRSPLQALNTDGFHIGSSWHLCYFYLLKAMLLRVFKREVFHSAIFFFKSRIILSVPVSVISGFSAISKRLGGRDRNSFS